MVEGHTERRDVVRLEDYLRILKERAWIVTLAVVVVVGIAAILSFTATPLYSAAADLVYQRTYLDTEISGYGLYSYDYDRDRTIQTLTSVVNRDEALLTAVKDRLDSSRSPRELAGMVTVVTTEGSDLVTLRAVSDDPAEAAAVANAFAEEFVTYRRNADRAAVAAAREVVKEQIDALGPDELLSDYALMLQEKYETLRILESMQNGGFTIVRRAIQPVAPYTPRTKRDLVLAFLVGIVLGCGLAVLAEYLDRRVKDEKGLERLSGLPVLSTVPLIDGRWIDRKKQTSPGVVGFEGSRLALLEPFRTLRSNLQYYDTDGSLRTLLVTSGLPQEGKTVMTVDLAISLALSGKRVIVLEADLRRPRMHEYLGLSNQVGLSSVLAGRCTLANALQMVLLDSFIPPEARRDEGGSEWAVLRKNLYCVTSGPLPPNPAELLDSARMEQVVAELRDLTDHVLIDTPPLLPVSDALIVAPLADAVLVAARLYSSTRDEIEEVCGLLRRSGVRVIGVVAMGAKERRRGKYYRHGYRYSYGYDY